jgi:aconitate hydratase
MDRHVIANMGAELGATTSVFPADEQVRAFLEAEGRPEHFTGLTADDDAGYDVTGEIDLARVEPLIAKPTSPGNVVPVREVAGEPVFQVVVGSSANPGLRDFAIVAAIVDGRQAHPQVSVDVNPTSRQILADLTTMGGTLSLIQSGARIHQAGCMGCIGMGQAPAIGRNSLRTVPRNFPGRSGTDEDAVWLCSPETAAAAALTGQITDPRELPSALRIDYPQLDLPAPSGGSEATLEPPLPAGEAQQVELAKAPSIGSLPDFEPMPGDLRATVAIKVGDDISTDEILPAGARVLPFRSDIAKLAEFTFSQVDDGYVERAREAGTHVIVAGENYGQGSSREHAVIAPRSLGLRLVLAKSYARIHWQNLANFGVLAAEFTDPSDYDRIDQGDELSVDGLPAALGSAAEFTVHNQAKNQDYVVRHRLSPRQATMVRAGGQIPLVRNRT